MRTSICASLVGLIFVSVFLILPFTSKADVLLHDIFDDKNIDIFTWNPSNAQAIFIEDGVLVLDQKASGGDWVGIETIERFPDCVISYDWTLAEWSGEGDCGGHLRHPAGGDGSYRMRWGWGSNTSVNLVDGVAHPPVGAWQAFPGCSSTHRATSQNFRLKASFFWDVDINVIKVKIKDLDTGDQVADWLYEDDWYDSGSLQFEAWKYGIVNVDNVVVATLDWEEKVFADDFNPETLEGSGFVKAVEMTGKLSTTWSKIRSQ